MNISSSLVAWATLGRPERVRWANAARIPAAKPFSSPTCADITIERQRPGAAEAKREQSGEIEQVGLVPRLTEMRSRSVVGDELDRAESVGQMDGENCNEQDNDHGRGGERHKSPAEDEQSADHLDDSTPTEVVLRRSARTDFDTVSLRALWAGLRSWASPPNSRRSPSERYFP